MPTTRGHGGISDHSKLNYVKRYSFWILWNWCDFTVRYLALRTMEERYSTSCSAEVILPRLYSSIERQSHIPPLPVPPSSPPYLAI